MDKQPQTKIPLWLTVDVTIIVIGVVLVSLGAWLGFSDVQPLHLFAKVAP